jgi:hypothetical protein
MFEGGQAKKFGNKPRERDGHWFHSGLEESVYCILKRRQEAGEIEILQCQDAIYLTRARIKYEVDFKCKEVATGKIFWAEAKGFANERWPMKKKLWKFYGPGPLEIFMGLAANPILKEIIIPAFDAEPEAE